MLAHPTLFLCGDVMLGRGIDQLLAHPNEPTIHEGYLKDARDYVALVEEQSGPILRPVVPERIWGDALEELSRARPDARIINLETSITSSGRFWPDKGIHYRLHPRNVAALTCAKVDVCVLANNHVLDFDRDGLVQTLETLARARIAFTGAGRNEAEAYRPALVELAKDQDLRVLGVGTEMSGIPPEWAAADGRSGVAFVPELTEAAAAELCERLLRQKRRSSDLTCVSLHWGSNWGYELPDSQLSFAHRLIDGGVDLVHGHSSHHPRGLEVYRGRLILYGCGDFISDYEGISGYEQFRGDLRPMYLVTLDGKTGALERLRIVQFVSRRLRLDRAEPADARWLARTITEASERFGTRVVANAEGVLELALG
jgi:poly-gamma-glutamate synthesis protein (capsule biosynthesis protein)